ncbi:hypothetical protein CARUB_v10022357mg [Capsella rubella]|uniref:RING-type E3 ubiquitin transferase n=1 Tax=Capsella rubella TaxID=81985 RepID=R0IDL8_9BRAS|nr:RING finger protein 44 [Capsella rubella]EOA34783.1 hypothetical protein CARUB_v10022357mg [Capsella rubella]
MSGKVYVSIGPVVMHKSTSNTVEIRVTRKNVVGSTTPPPPFPTPHLLLNKILSFDEYNMYPLLYPALPDPYLCNILSYIIASEAKRVPGPLYISLNVTLSPPIFELPEMETCPICLEEGRDLIFTQKCGHVFHDYCINEWLLSSKYCPLCRADLLKDE